MKRSNPRRDRVAQAMRAALAEVIEREVKDPRVHAAGLVSVNQVELNRDMSVAKVYISFIGGHDSPTTVAQAMAGLRTAAGFLRGPVGRKVRLSRAPELRFAHDNRAEFGQHISEILRADEHRSHHRDRPDDDEDSGGDG